MTWDLKGRESLSDYGLKGFWIKMVTNLTSGDRLVFQFFFSLFFFFSFFFRDFEYQFVWVWWVRMALDSIELLECPACTNSLHPPIHQVSCLLSAAAVYLFIYFILYCGIICDFVCANGFLI
jgi:hypothetical protein